MDNSKTFNCVCGSVYLQKQGLYRHRKTCDKYNNKQCDSEIQKQVNNSEYDNLVQTQLLTLQSDNARLLEQIQRLENDKVKLQNQVIELQEREIKMLQLQLSNKNGDTLGNTEPVKSVEPVKIVEPPKQTETNKKPSVKLYLATCNPVTFTDFMDKYVPTIEDYSNVIKQGIEHGIVKNITTYLLNYKKEKYPIIITNKQAKRMKMLVYETNNKTNQWNKYESYKAREFLEKMANWFSNKLYKYLAPVFKAHYPAIEDKYHTDNESHCAIRQSLLNQLIYAENYNRKIAENIMEHFIISNDDHSEDCEDDDC